MKSIKSITIESFQSHAHTEISPAPPGGLTVIVGPSGHGKTAVLRALRWSDYNQPQGTGFMRKGAKFIRVTQEYDDGAMVIRERTASTNRYITVTPEAGRQVFEGFAGDVPLEIQQITGVRPVKVADLTLTPNLARQLDGPFLGEEAVSAGTRAKVLGRIAGVDEVDHASKILATDQFRRGQEEKRLDREIEDIEKQIARYDHLPALGMRIDSLGRIVTAVRAAQERRIAVAGLRDQLVQVRAGRQVAETILGRWLHLAEAEALLSIAGIAMGRRNGVDGLRVRWQSIQSGLAEATGKLRSLTYLPALEDAVSSLGAATAQQQALGGLRTRLQTVSAALESERAKARTLAGVPAALEILSSVQVATTRRQTLGNLRTRAQNVAAALTSEQAKASTLEGVPRALKALTTVEVSANRRTQVAKLRQGILTIRDSIRFANMALDRLAGADKALEALASVREAYGRRARISGLSQSLFGFRDDIKGAEARVVWFAKQAEAAQREYVEALIAAGKCPTCGSEIHPEHLKEVI